MLAGGGRSGEEEKEGKGWAGAGERAVEGRGLIGGSCVTWGDP